MYVVITLYVTLHGSTVCYAETILVIEFCKLGLICAVCSTVFKKKKQLEPF